MPAFLSSPSAADPQGHRRAQLFVALLVLAMGLLVAHSLLFNFVTDDAFISFVYARNLARHGQLVFNLGERVEGYTNFLFTVLLALGITAGAPPEILSRVIGTLAGGLGLLAAAWLHRQVRADAPRAVSAWDALPALLLAGIPGYACWSSGGLETQLFTLLCTLGAAFYIVAEPSEPPAAGRRDPLLIAALLLGLSALTRPEGYLFFACCGLHRLFFAARSGRYLPQRRELLALAVFLLLTVPHLIFRRAYYGYFVPNTFYVKSSGGAGAWLQGGYYLFAFCRDLKLFVLPLVYVAGLFRPTTAAAGRRYLQAGAVTYLISAPFLLYVASVGGDFMGLYRFMMPIVPLNVVCGALGLHRLLSGWRRFSACMP